MKGLENDQDKLRTYFFSNALCPRLEKSHNTHEFKRRRKCEQAPSSYLVHSIFPAKNEFPQFTLALYQVQFHSKCSWDRNVKLRSRDDLRVSWSLVRVSVKLYWAECSGFLRFFPLQLSYLPRANCSNSHPQWKDLRNRSRLQGRESNVLICWPTGHKSPLTDGEKTREVLRGLDAGFYEQSRQWWVPLKRGHHVLIGVIQLEGTNNATGKQNAQNASG